MQVLLAALRDASYPAAQSAAVWAINALVQGQKSTLPALLQPAPIATLLACVRPGHGAAPGTVRLLLVAFLHSGRHEELRAHLHDSPAALRALLEMLQAGPAEEPTKWAASLLSTLCWQAGGMKLRMAELDAPAVRRPPRVRCAAHHTPRVVIPSTVLCV